MRSYGLQILDSADNEARKEYLRAIQMMGCWNTGFREVTGDRLWLLKRRPNASSSDTATSSTGPDGKKWLVTKAVQIKGKPVCWCIPVEVKTGGEINVTLNESNTFDLKTAYDEAMREGEEVESK